MTRFQMKDHPSLLFFCLSMECIGIFEKYIFNRLVNEMEYHSFLCNQHGNMQFQQCGSVSTITSQKHCYVTFLLLSFMFGMIFVILQPISAHIVCGYHVRVNLWPFDFTCTNYAFWNVPLHTPPSSTTLLIDEFEHSFSKNLCIHPNNFILIPFLCFHFQCGPSLPNHNAMSAALPPNHCWTTHLIWFGKLTWVIVVFDICPWHILDN